MSINDKLDSSTDVVALSAPLFMTYNRSGWIMNWILHLECINWIHILPSGEVGVKAGSSWTNHVASSITFYDMKEDKHSYSREFKSVFCFS